MTIYGTIKAAISVKQAAEHYGLKVNRNGMACCPFHNDRHPSLKLNEDYFFCFGCGAKGDVIDLVARLFNMSSYEAAQKLASDFGLDPKPPTVAAMAKPRWIWNVKAIKLCKRNLHKNRLLKTSMFPGRLFLTGKMENHYLIL